MKLSTLKTILSHPLNKNRKVGALLTFFKRAIAIRIHPFPMIYPFVEGTHLVVDKGMSSAELQIYTGLYDTEEMLFLMHFLRPEDTFVDVGANVGVYSILASGVCKAKSIAFEPIPSTFKNLQRNISFNNLLPNTELHNMGVGDKKGILTFTDSLDAINHVILEDNFKGPTRQVLVDSLDNILRDSNISILKIDVEGFEANVINGAEKTLSNPNLKGVIIETNGLSDQYEFGQNFIHDKLIKYGFEPYDFNPTLRKFTKLQSTKPTNTIYLRDYQFVLKRIITGSKIRVKELTF